MFKLKYRVEKVKECSKYGGWIRTKAARSGQSDLNLHVQQKAIESRLAS